MNRTRALIFFLTMLFGALMLCLWPAAPKLTALCLASFVVGATSGYLRLNQVLTTAVAVLYLGIMLLTVIHLPVNAFLLVGGTFAFSHVAARKF